MISVTAVIGSTEESAIDPLTEILTMRDEFKIKVSNSFMPPTQSSTSLRLKLTEQRCFVQKIDRIVIIMTMPKVQNPTDTYIPCKISGFPQDTFPSSSEGESLTSQV